ncbi:MAG TPA: universal stress protein, partial [Thermoanaerobaculia bacterium]|nr:universal stress protein [Thermoanaerobaculia bacterium]
LYERPRTLFVATFLGAGTVVVGRADEGVANFGAFSLPIPPDVPHESGSRVLLLCRPEHVVLTESEPGPGVPVFGRGSIVDESFAGAQRRVRVRVPRAPRIRQVSPVPVFGEEHLLLETLVAPDRPLPADVWVSLRAWKILDRPAPRVLAVDRGEGDAAALGAAARLASALDGTMTALAVTEDAERVEGLGPALRERARALGAPLADARVRAGRLVPQVLAEQSESVYDVLVLDGGREAGGLAARSRAPLLRIVERSATPMLIVPGAWPSPRRILVCTAVGEPGKTVVRMAGWLARNLGAAVTLFHAQLGEGEPDFVRAHLERGLAALRAMDVPCELALRTADSAAEGILAERARCGAEMIAMGAPGPRLRAAPARDDVTLKVMAASGVAVLIVPEHAW